jgi:acid phosphatase (class A)
MHYSNDVSRRDACAGLLLGLISVGAKARPIDLGRGAQSYFLLPADFDINELMIDPPPSDDLSEAQLLMTYQAARVKHQIEQIEAESINPVPLFWRCAGLDEAKYPDHALLLNRAVVDTETIVIDLKRRFNRRRPNTVLPSIRPVVPVPWHSSYPSGHATQAIVIASLLSRWAPDSSERLNKFAIQVGRNREIAGLHYPSDTNAGFRLGRQLAELF